LTTEQKKGEYYLTDIYGILRKAGKKDHRRAGGDRGGCAGAQHAAAACRGGRGDAGADSAGLRESGVTIVSGINTYIEAGVSIGPDTVIQPFTFIGREPASEPIA
jgi:bifunctional UDP-N-acetylglucosamine pyrophosphorylase / glucosamine-1-phosphate N-acetyltransferase